jgi:hypothetical protein
MDECTIIYCQSKENETDLWTKLFTLKHYKHVLQGLKKFVIYRNELQYRFKQVMELHVLLYCRPIALLVVSKAILLCFHRKQSVIVH